MLLLLLLVVVAVVSVVSVVVVVLVVGGVVVAICYYCYINMSMDLKVSLISSDSDDSSSSSDSITLSELHSRLAGQGKAMVIDLWHTKCVKCPAALSHLNDEASGSSDIVFVACALSLGDGNRELVADLVSE